MTSPAIVLARPPIFELVEHLSKAMLVIVGAVSGGLHVWSRVDPRSAAARRLRRLWPRRLALGLLGFGVLAVIAMDVLERDADDVVPMLDHVLRPLARAAARLPFVHAGAEALGWITGAGLGVLVLAVAAVLYVRQRRAESLTILFGTVGAWAMSGLCKITFSVPRPRPERWQYGFPSGHAFVTLVALGLLAWSAGRRASPARRAALMVAAVVGAVVTAASRLILDMHWLSDVVGGLAAGTVWLNATIALAEHRWQPRSVSPLQRRDAPARRRA
jgi:undecaprenyl-diphosphatase